jgi:cellulose biosynthesis protein BcsQ
LATIKIIIIDVDTEYLNSLLNYLVKHLPHQYIVKAYSDLKVINIQLGLIREEKNTLIVIDEGLMHQIQTSFLVEPLVLTSEPRGDGIHKYSSGKNILHKIEEKLKGIDHYTPLTENLKSFLSIGFYSPIGGVGVSNLSLISSILLSQKKFSTLFISLDINSGLELILEKDSSNSLSKYFYYYLSEPNLLIGKLKQNIKTYKGLAYISSFDSVIDYEDITEEHLVGFFKLIKRELDYDRIIIDFPSLLSQKNIALMKHMNHFVLVSQGRQSDYYKLMHLKNDLIKYDADDLIHEKNAVLLVNQIRDMNLLNQEEKNPFGLEEKVIPYSEDLIIKEDSDISYKISSQFKYVLETAFEKKKGAGNESY